MFSDIQVNWYLWVNRTKHQLSAANDRSQKWKKYHWESQCQKSYPSQPGVAKKFVISSLLAIHLWVLHFHVFTIQMHCNRAVVFSIENTMITEIISRETFPGDTSRQLKINRNYDYFTSLQISFWLVYITLIFYPWREWVLSLWIDFYVSFAQKIKHWVIYFRNVLTGELVNMHVNNCPRV